MRQADANDDQGGTVIQINSPTWRSTCDKQMHTMTKGAQ
jgi:hypothetical protein